MEKFNIKYIIWAFLHKNKSIIPFFIDFNNGVIINLKNNASTCIKENIKMTLGKYGFNLEGFAIYDTVMLVKCYLSPQERKLFLSSESISVTSINKQNILQLATLIENKIKTKRCSGKIQNENIK